MAKTIAPTGLSITRDGYEFYCNWKFGDGNYDAGQKFWYRLRVNDAWQSWEEISVSATDSSVTINLDSLPYYYYPNTKDKFYGLQFCVRGKKADCDWSSDTYCTFSTREPRKPTVSSALTSSNVLKISYDTNTTDDDNYIFMRYEFQTMLVENSDVKDGSQLDWSGVPLSYGQTSSGTYTITEDSSVIAFESHTRWYRIRAVGVRSVSNWAYTKHVYAEPLSAVITNYRAGEISESSGLALDITWTASSPASRPIDEVLVEYAKAVPIAGMLPPVNPSWQTAVVLKDTAGEDGASINISGSLDNDQCLFARVVTRHDNRESYSNIVLASKGTLTTPSNLSVSVNGNSATVTATNNSTACVYTGSDSTVKRQFLGIIYKSTERYTAGITIGVIPTGTNRATVALPVRLENEQYTIEVRAYVGTYSSITNSENVTVYTVYAEMLSEIVSTQGVTPKSPTNLKAEVLNGTDVRASWTWAWNKADAIELSWSQDEYAWQSNEQPDSFTIDGYADNWLIKGLETGKTYYLKARFKLGESYSSYTDAISFVMSTAPVKPVIALSASTVAKTGDVVVSWTYTSTDDSEQEYAEVVSNNQVIGHSRTEKYIKLYIADLGWQAGSYDLKLRVKSVSGSFSEYSDTVYINVAPEIQAVISSTSLVGNLLKALPLTVSASGGGTSNNISLEIVRSENYVIMRPDGELHNGYEGELVYTSSRTGSGQFTIDVNDLIGALDDGAKYKIIVTVQDGIGQISKVEKDFKVNWTHQALIPTGSVVVNGTTANITPRCSNIQSGDVCDIYRLGADKPTLILEGGQFGETYTDYYPAIGGGYRIVFKTLNGDYITASNTPAWVDIPSEFTYNKTIIDFGTDKVELYYNVDTSHNWSKDFVETKYLGGSIQGDWNPAISKSGTITAVTLSIVEEETVKALRRLAEYAGICNVRTLDGSSYHADVQVSETRSHDKYGMVKEFTLNITRVDSQGYDAIIYGG